MSTLSAIEQELVLFRVLVTGSVKVFCRIFQSNSFSCFANLQRRPDGDDGRDKVDYKGVNVVGIACQEFSCKGRHCQILVMGRSLEGEVAGVYKFECTYARKGQKVGELGLAGNHFGGMTPSKCGSHSNQDQKREPDRTDFTADGPFTGPKTTIHDTVIVLRFLQQIQFSII